MNEYLRIAPFVPARVFKANVPGSKSITNRALLLAALSEGPCLLHGVLFSDDSRVFIGALRDLGFELEVSEEERKVRITGLGGRLPVKEGRLYVGSAGTAARFITALLSVAGGRFEMTSSAQMEKRPMEPFLTELARLGVKFTFHKEEGHFPFLLESRGLGLEGPVDLSLDTTASSQFASAMMLAAGSFLSPVTLTLTGDRTEGSYIRMTETMLEEFGIAFKREGNVLSFPRSLSYKKREYFIEPDASAAGYFFAAAAILSASLVVKGLHGGSMQGDIKFVGLLRRMGCTVEDTLEGLMVTGPQKGGLKGIRVNMKDYSDQVLTLCAIAPFAKGPVRIEGVGHIRRQESDRLMAAQTELTKLGVSCHLIEEETGIEIIPDEAWQKEAGQTAEEVVVETYEDHRVAMSFALIGLVRQGVIIHHPECCQKTFEGYFDEMERWRKEE